MHAPNRAATPAEEGKGILRRFRRSKDGAVAVEFALVSIPFFGILFAIIEVAMFFFVGQILDNATSKAARLIRTGQAQTLGMSETGFKTAICDQIAVLTDCASSLTVNVQVYNSFGSIPAPAPIDPVTGLMKPTQFAAGGSGDIVVVQAFYKWPTYFDIFPASGSTLADGSRLIGSVFAFRNEPF